MAAKREKIIVVALGGNAILQPGQTGPIQQQLGNVDIAYWKEKREQ